MEEKENILQSEFTPEEEKQIASQLRMPRGDDGKVMALRMNNTNAFLTTKAYECLAQFEGDHVLEIGFGNGHGLGPLIAAHKKVYGVDHSEYMVRDATKYHARAIYANRLRLEHGSAAMLAFPKEYFPKIVSINTLYFWNPAKKVARELFRVLSPGGVLVLGFRSKSTVEKLGFTQHGFTLYEAEEVETLLTEAGFVDIKWDSVPDEERDAVTLSAKKP